MCDNIGQYCHIICSEKSPKTAKINMGGGGGGGGKGGIRNLTVK